MVLSCQARPGQARLEARGWGRVAVGRQAGRKEERKEEREEEREEERKGGEGGLSG